MLVQDKEVYGVVYKITNKINNKVYIGQTTVGFQRRYTNGIWWKQVYSTELRNEAKECGIENFEVIEEFDIAHSKEELDAKEWYWTLYYGSIYPEKGYNRNYGGKVGNIGEETRKRSRKSRDARIKINNHKKLIKELIENGKLSK